MWSAGRGCRRGAFGSVNPLRHAALHLQHFGPPVVFVGLLAVLYVLEERDTVGLMLNQNTPGKGEGVAVPDNKDGRKAPVGSLGSACCIIHCVLNTSIHSMFKGLLLYLHSRGRSGLWGRNGYRSRDDVIIRLSCGSHISGPQPRAHLLLFALTEHDGAVQLGSDHMTQGITGNKGFFFSFFSANAEEMTLQVLYIVSP